MSQTLTKQPAEDRLYDMDFSPRLATGENITSVDTVVQQEIDINTLVRSVTTDLTLGTPTFALQVGQVKIGGGLDGKYYLVTWTITTSLSNTVESEGILFVQDTPSA